MVYKTEQIVLWFIMYATLLHNFKIVHPNFIIFIHTKMFFQCSLINIWPLKVFSLTILQRNVADI